MLDASSPVREREVLRLLKDPSAEAAFLAAVDLAPVMDQPWHNRIADHMGIRLGRLRAIRSKRTFTPRRPPGPAIGLPAAAAALRCGRRRVGTASGS